jgi:hypothetical protein
MKNRNVSKLREDRMVFTEISKPGRSHTQVTRMNNILVAYDGGGYDGCIWERNFFFFFNGSFYSRDDKFENIFTSGHRGVKNVEQAVELLMKDDPLYDIRLYDFKTEKGIEDFQAHEPVPWAVEIVNLFADWREGGETRHNKSLRKPWFKCSKTDKVCYGGSEEERDERGYAVDWHGCGGIAQTSDVMVCGEYYQAHTCGYCGEYTEDIVQGLCSYHFTEAFSNIEKQKTQGFIYLEYSSFFNKFLEEQYDFDSRDWTNDDGERMFIVSVKSKRYVMHQEFMVLADNEAQAIEYVSLYLDGDYFEAKAETGHKFLSEIDLINFCR